MHWTRVLKNETWSEKVKNLNPHTKKGDFLTTVVSRGWSPAHGKGRDRTQSENESCGEDGNGVRKKRERKEEEKSNELLFEPIHLVGLHLLPVALVSRWDMSSALHLWQTPLPCVCKWVWQQQQQPQHLPVCRNVGCTQGFGTPCSGHLD